MLTVGSSVLVAYVVRCGLGALCGLGNGGGSINAHWVPMDFMGLVDFKYDTGVITRSLVYNRKLGIEDKGMARWRT